MANVYGALSTRFKPFSFDEMIKPLLLAQEAYDKADDELTLLYEDAATKAFNFAAQDGKEKAMYNSIMNKLKVASDALHSGDKSVFRDINNINKEYRQTMIPIQMKLAKRAELIKEQRDKQAANGKLRFSVDYSKESLDNINDSSTYDTINLDDIYKTVGTEFAGIASSYVRNDLPLERVGNTDHYVHTSGLGFTKEDVDDAFYGNKGKPNTNNPIYQYYNQKETEIDAMSGIDSTTKADMKKTIREAIVSNAGTFKSQVLTDPYYKHAKDHLRDTDKKENIELVSFNSDDPNNIKEATIKLGNQFYKVDVIGLEKDADGNYKKDEKGRYIPIYGTNIQRPGTEKVLAGEEILDYEYNEDNKLIKVTKKKIYSDGSSVVVEEPVNIDDNNGDYMDLAGLAESVPLGGSR